MNTAIRSRTVSGILRRTVDGSVTKDVDAVLEAVGCRCGGPNGAGFRRKGLGRR